MHYFLFHRNQLKFLIKAIPKFLSVTVLFLLMTHISWGQVATIGDGTSGKVYPLGSFYAYERSSAIYTAAEINENGTIYALRWYANKSGLGPRPLKIYLQETSDITYDSPSNNWNTEKADAILVYEGTITPIEGWNTFYLDTPYNFTSDNLKVLVEANYGGNGNGGGTNGNSVRYTETPSYTHAYWFYPFNSDNSTYGNRNRTMNRPNIQIDFNAPPPPCDGIPVGGVATIDPISGESGTDIIASATGYETGYGMTYQWEYKYNANPWQESDIYLGYTDFPMTIEGTTGDMIEYRLKVSCTASDDVAYSSSAFFEVTPRTAYCVPTYLYTSNYLNSITVEGSETDLSYSASSFPIGGYVVETEKLLEVVAGDELTVTTKYAGGYNTVAIWVNWDNDFEFIDEAPERVAESVFPPGAIQTFTFIVPGGTPVGDYRMRIRSINGNLVEVTPCGEGTSGSTVDFTMTVIPPPTCIKPSDLLVEETTANTADISWIEGSTETAWNITWGAPGFTPGDTNEAGRINTNTNPYKIENLTTNTYYDVYIQADCGVEDGLSNWVGPLNFTTDCGVVSHFFEGFETTDSYTLPNCWSEVGSSYRAYAQSNVQISGARNLYLFGETTVSMPTVGNASAGTHQMVLKMLGSFYSTGGILEFGYLTDPFDETSFITLSSIVSDYVVQEFTTIPTGMPAGDVVFALRGMDNSKAILIDDVSWEPLPGCIPPTNLEIDALSANTADIKWIDVGTGTSWEISWGTVGYSPGDSDEIDTATSSSTSYQITNISADLNYDVYVKTDCGGGLESTWTGPLKILSYCKPQLRCDDGDIITNVTFREINNNTGCSSNGYGNYSSLTASVNAGETYPISVTVGNGNYVESVSVWIDFDESRTFDQDEFFFIGTGSGEVVTGNITIPANTLDGEYRMRVRLAAMDEPYATWDLSCDQGYVFGETEDYTINVISPTDYIYANGSWTPAHPSGNATSVDAIFVTEGSAVGVDAINGLTNAKNITIDEGATLEVASVLNVYGDLIIEGDLIFLSDANGNGELGVMAGSITGNATVHSYMSANRSYRMVSPAVTTATSINANWQEGVNNTSTDFSQNQNPNPSYGTHITGSTTGANGFDATQTGNVSIFTANASLQEFVAVPNTDQKQLQIGEPYLLFVRGDRSVNLNSNTSFGETILRSTGLLHKGAQTQNFGILDENKFVMFGNPYQSAVDVNKVIAGSTNLNPHHYYLYDPNLGDYGCYITVLLSGVGNTLDANEYLQPGMAAQAATLANGETIATFSESDKAPGNFNTIHRLPPSENNTFNVELYTAENFDNGGNVHDSFNMHFAHNQDNRLTSEDALKPMNFYENLCLNHEGTYLSFERRTLPQDGEIFPLYSVGYQHTQYVLKMDLNGLDYLPFYLDDSFTGESTLLNQDNTIYHFVVDLANNESKAADRFAIRVGEQRLSVDNNGLFDGVTLYPNPMGDELHLSNPKNIQLESISIFDLTGRLVQTVAIKGTTSDITLDVSALSSSIYLVEINGPEGKTSKRLIKE